jgi:hypothetical protein
MQVGKTLGRILRLGFFVSLGVASLVGTACGARSAPRPRPIMPPDASATTAPAADGPTKAPVAAEKQARPDHTDVIYE